MQQETARVLASERLGGGMAAMVLEAPGTAAGAQPGQFVMVRCNGLPLRRPLSVHAAGEGRIAVLFRISGQGTTWLAGCEPGVEVDITGPLGVGYSLPEERVNVLLLAGGLGIAPLQFLAARIADRNEVLLVQGARTAAELYEAPEAIRRMLPSVGLPACVRRLTATDDGSAGARGTAVQLALPHLGWAERIYICGPVAMCVAARACASDVGGQAGLDAESERRLLDAEVSLELRMGCGVGACYACAIPTASGRKKVCHDGPVFRFGDVRWDSLAT